MQVPLLIISESVCGQTGLGRIAREIARNAHEHLSDVFKVGTLGCGGRSSEFKWKQYRIPTPPAQTGWAVPVLPDVWEEFAGDEPGIIMTIWNASWLEWFTYPELLEPSPLKRFLQSDKFKRWGYLPIDATGPNNMTGVIESDIMGRFDRILMYTEWSKKLLRGRLQFHPIDSLPHGTDGKVFYPRDRKEAREKFVGTVVKRSDISGQIDDDCLLLGCIATNTPRKDWGLAFEVCAELVRRGLNVGLWAHTDRFRSCWDLLTLADDFGMRERTIFTDADLSSDTLAWGVCACNCSLGIGSGEGWGLNMAESLACGVPVVTHNYAAATEFVPPEFRVEPAAWRWEGYHCNRRPVGNPSDWADKILEVKNRGCRLGTKFLWDGPNGAWSQWAEWLKKGIQ